VEDGAMDVPQTQGELRQIACPFVQKIAHFAFPSTVQQTRCMEFHVIKKHNNGSVCTKCVLALDRVLKINEWTCFKAPNHKE